jgi:hypothetical protein
MSIKSRHSCTIRAKELMLMKTTNKKNESKNPNQHAAIADGSQSNYEQSLM